MNIPIPVSVALPILVRYGRSELFLSEEVIVFFEDENGEPKTEVDVLLRQGKEGRARWSENVGVTHWMHKA